MPERAPAPICGHEQTSGSGSLLVCALEPGHAGLHEDRWADRNGRICRTNYDDDGYASWANRTLVVHGRALR